MIKKCSYLYTSTSGALPYKMAKKIHFDISDICNQYTLHEKNTFVLPCYLKLSLHIFALPK